MFKIRGRDDLHFAYSLLGLLKKQGARDEQMNEIKKEIRRYYKGDVKDRRIIHEDGIDGYTVLIRCPENVSDDESAEEWFDYEERRECRPSMYDCTGQPFTIWHRFVERRGGWYCYHRVGFDV